MPNSWSILIIQNSHGTITFWPDVPGAQPGQPLGVIIGDNVTWNNRTRKTLVLQSIPPGTYLTDKIPPGKASDPIFNVAETVVYSCKDPPQPQHSIVVVPTS